MFKFFYCYLPSKMISDCGLKIQIRKFIKMKTKVNENNFWSNQPLIQNNNTHNRTVYQNLVLIVGQKSLSYWQPQPAGVRPIFAPQVGICSGRRRRSLNCPYALAARKSKKERHIFFSTARRASSSPLSPCVCECAPSASLCVCLCIGKEN